MHHFRKAGFTNSSKWHILKMVCTILKEFKGLAQPVSFKLVHFVCKLTYMARQTNVERRWELHKRRPVDYMRDYCLFFM